MPELRYAVHGVKDEQGVEHSFKPGDEIPEWAQRVITNPNCWVNGELPTFTQPDSPDSAAPPRAGKGSGRDEWAAYAASLGLELPDDAGRDEIIAAVDAAE